jgi:CRISPR-associated exonuclease Cas4
MQVTGTLISYYFYCKRRLWLHANGIQFEDTSEDVALGVVIEDSTYLQRSEKFKQIKLGPIKIDFYDSKNKVIHEVKKSPKFHETHIWQLRYYIYMLEQAGVTGVEGVLEYPKERKKEKVLLSDPDRKYLKELKNEIELLIRSKTCPLVINKPRCKNCSYYDFCYSQEPE